MLLVRRNGWSLESGKPHRIVRISALRFTERIKTLDLFTHGTRHLRHLPASTLAALDESTLGRDGAGLEHFECQLVQLLLGIGVIVLEALANGTLDPDCASVMIS